MKQKENQNLIHRPPVVVVLGHVDAGKTSILDTIRKTHVAEKESGGITQHIGAYQIEEKNQKITFLDTPGHEAFFQMRSRGAKVADIALLIIDAVEGIQAQTKEVINLVKKTGLLPIVVLNKVDKSEADPERVKRELVKEGILVEEMGGKIPAVKVSAKDNQGINELLEMILLVAEMEKEKLKVNLENPAQGAVIESYSDSFRGPTATLLLIDGTLKSGDVIGTLSGWTKIKSLENFLGKPLERALPSDPVIVFGFNQVPKVGEEFKVFPDSENARSYIKISQEKAPEVLEITENQRVLNLILKTDVLGSSEAIEEILKNLPQEKVILRILKSEVGDINESDFKLAKGAKAFIISFRVKTDKVVESSADREKVKIMNFEIIYELVEEIRKLMERIEKPEIKRVDLGKVKVLGKFLTEKNRQIIGGRVTEGQVQKGVSIEVFRNEEKIGEGKLINLQRNKKDIALVPRGEECGILFEGGVQVESGDILVFYQEVKEK